jgi:hypothetical protein
MRPVHWIAIDCVVAAFLAIIGGAQVGRNFPGEQARWPLVLLFMAVVFIPVALRRRAPNTAFGALLILGVLVAKMPPAVTAGVFLAAAFVLYTVTVEGRKRTGAAALGLVLAVMVFLAAAGSTTRPRGGDAAGAVFVPIATAVRGDAAAPGREQRGRGGAAADRARTARRRRAQHVGDRGPGRLRPVRHRREPGRRQGRARRDPGDKQGRA